MAAHKKGGDYWICTTVSLCTQTSLLNTCTARCSNHHNAMAKSAAVSVQESPPATSSSKELSQSCRGIHLHLLSWCILPSPRGLVVCPSLLSYPPLLQLLDLPQWLLSWAPISCLPSSGEADDLQSLDCKCQATTDIPLQFTTRVINHLQPQQKDGLKERVCLFCVASYTVRTASG